MARVGLFVAGALAADALAVAGMAALDNTNKTAFTDRLKEKAWEVAHINARAVGPLLTAATCVQAIRGAHSELALLAAAAGAVNASAALAPSVIDYVQSNELNASLHYDRVAPALQANALVVGAVLGAEALQTGLGSISARRLRR